MTGSQVVVHACDICGRPGADHQTPNGRWIHKACGLEQWHRTVRRFNEAERRRERGLCPSK